MLNYELLLIWQFYN